MKTNEKWHYTQFTDLLIFCRNLIELLCQEDLSPEEKAEKAKEIETDADSIIKNVVEQLDLAERLPFQKESVFDIAHGIDNVIDELEKAADRMKSYKVSLGEAGNEMLTLLSEAIEEAVLAISCLGKGRKSDQLREHCEHIKTLESEADIVHRRTIAEISDGKKAAIKRAREGPKNFDTVITLNEETDKANDRKEIIEILESAFDEIQKVANLIVQLRYEID